MWKQRYQARPMISQSFGTPKRFASNQGLRPWAPAELGKAVIYVDDKREEAKSGGRQNVCYRAEIKDLQIAGDWAFEWGYFSYKESANSKPGRGKVLRVIQRQPDGSWKFARVIGFTETVESAAPLSQPCE
jgi:hypothetical protein